MIWAVRAVVAAALIAGAVYGTHKVIYSLAHESTDDAFVEGVIVPISAEVKGQVTKVMVSDNQNVKKGDVLLELFSDDFSQVVRSRESTRARLNAEKQELGATVRAKTMALARVRADADAADAEASLTGKDLARAAQLRKEEVISQRQYDEAQSHAKTAASRADSARAAVEETKATIEALDAQLETLNYRIREAEATTSLAKLDLKRTVITAPVAGRVAKKNVDEGKFVQPGQPLLSIVDDSNLWVVGNFKETQIAHMKSGQPVDISVDAYPGVTFSGHVESFQPGTGAVFSLLPPQNATGNFVKVVQRVPVKILIDSKPDALHPLWPGLSVCPSVAIKTAPRQERVAGSGNVQVR